MPVQSGTRLGPYEVLSPLGAGGMGEVYRALDTNLKRQVAIKMLPQSVAADAERLARFQREAEVLAALNHPNIAQIYGLERQDGLFLVMELVEGEELAQRIARGPIPLDEAMRIAKQIAEALEAAHEQGIIHRDLKPANIKVREDGTVKVLDFGLAKALEQGSGIRAQGSANTMTSPTISRLRQGYGEAGGTEIGVILGTAAYMSPEQASGKPVDKRADIWAFGVVLWEMVTGRQMFQGETISHVLAAVLTTEPDLTAVPLRVRHLVTNCLEKDPRKRLRDIGDAMNLVQDPGVPARDESPGTRWVAVLGWVATVVLAIALAVMEWSRPATQTDGVTAPPIVRFQVERPSVDPYNQTAAAFAVSPDGRFLAHYTTGSNGSATLTVRTLATGESREVPGSGVLGPQPPFWSPDSRQVVYVTQVAARAFNLATAATRDVCTCRFRGGSWNRDGVILLGSAPGREPIRRVSLDDRTPVPVTNVDSSSGEQDTWPVFLPDGRRFLFTRSKPRSGTVTYLGTLDGGEPKRIADGSRHLLATSPHGLGSYLLGIDAVGLVAQPLDMTTMALTGEPLVVVAGAAAASISDNGVLTTSGVGNRPVTSPTWFDRRGTEVGRVGSPGLIQSVDLRPDGKAVALQELRGGVADRGSGGDIWIRDLAGGNRRLTFTANDNDPAWSPDGTRIIVSSGREGTVNLYERAADGSGQETRLFPDDHNTYVNDWSPDGRWVIYTIPKAADNTLDLDLWLLPMDGRSERKPAPYLATPAREAQAEFSPDGRFVAYTSTDKGEPEVFVQPFPNASDGKWLVSNGGGAEPHWSRDGKELFYFAGQTLMAVPVRLQPTFSNGSPSRLFDAPVQPWYVNDSDRSQVAPDSKRFLLLVAAGKNATPPIDIVVNWPALLSKK